MVRIAVRVCCVLHTHEDRQQVMLFQLGNKSCWCPAFKHESLIPQQVVLLAPTINQASRRLYLARAIIHLSRELVLADGFGRMRRNDIASFLDHLVRQVWGMGHRA